jgi:hypothetical protein
MPEETACKEDGAWCGVVGDRIWRSVQFLTDGDPWPLTGATVEAQVRETWSSPSPLMTATVTPVDEASGMFIIEFDGTDGRSVVTGDDDWSGVYDIQVTELGQTLPETIERGVFTLRPDATRA